MKWCASDCSILIYLVSYQNQIDNKEIQDHPFLRTWTCCGDVWNRHLLMLAHRTVSLAVEGASEMLRVICLQWSPVGVWSPVSSVSIWSTHPFLLSFIFYMPANARVNRLCWSSKPQMADLHCILWLTLCIKTRLLTHSNHWLSLPGELRLTYLTTFHSSHRNKGNI